MGPVLKKIVDRRKAERMDALDLLVTPERRAKAGEDYVIGGDDRTGKIVRLMDAPLERMRARGAIDGKGFSALQRYQHHWYHGGLLPGVGSVDLNRVFASDPSNSSGMPKSEAQAHHRRQYREANEHLGMRTISVVDRVVCQEWTLEAAGAELGWHSKPQAIAAASEVLRDAGYRLSKLWGIG